MKPIKFQYIVRLQYLGFRYSGWQKQPGQRTIEAMLLKTLRFIRPGHVFKVLASGRTDAKVSALDAACCLFTGEAEIADLDAFTLLLNQNLPPDIRVLIITKTSPDFNIIQSVKEKQYVYLFSFGAKFHPFCAPFMANFLEDLDIDLMRESAKLFLGTHDFSAYTARLQKNAKTIRTITNCQITTNTLFTANFFPEESFMFSVCGSGFMRYQIRMMMGALVQVGSGELNPEELRQSLEPGSKVRLTYVAPGSGLSLNRLEFQ
ncbi:MAG: tRNA pseudouridine(38-40) synthase TruA [Bacteroidota bacterium]